MSKKWVSLALAAMLTLSLAACGGTPTTTDNKATDAPKTETTEAPKEETKTETKEETPADNAEVVELTWFMGDPGTVPPDQAIVEEHLNTLSVPAVGVKMKTIYKTDEQVKLSMNAGDPFDITFTCEWYNNYAVQSNNGLFYDITEKLPAVAPDLYNFIPETVWKGSKINGKIFAIPVYKDTAASQYWQFKKEYIVDKLGIDVSKITTFEGIEEVFKKMKEDQPESYPFVVHQGVPALDSNFDMINRDAQIGLNYADNNNKVVLTYAHPEMVARLNKIHEWYKAGYINPDAATTEGAVSKQPVMSGQGFPGAEAIWSDGAGFEIVISKWYGPVLSTSSIRGAMNAVSASSKNVDKALEYLQFVNLNREYRDAIKYGIEGTHYEYTEDKEAVKLLKPDNYNPWGFSQATFFNMTPTVPSKFSTWELVKAENELAAKTANAATIGFSFNIENVEAEVAACKTVVEKYNKGLNTGTTDPAVELPKMYKDLEAAGHQAIIDEAQKQLDEFIATNK